MAAIFDDICLTFGGKRYTIKPTYTQLRVIEAPIARGGLGISFAQLSSRGATTEYCDIIAFLLREEDVEYDGKPVTSEDIYEVICTDPGSFGVPIGEVFSMIRTAYDARPRVKAKATAVIEIPGEKKG